MIRRSNGGTSASGAEQDFWLDPWSGSSTGFTLPKSHVRHDGSVSASAEGRAENSVLATQPEPSRAEVGGSLDFPAVIDLATLDGTNGFRIDGIGANDASGICVSTAGDFNGDGIDDIIIGAFKANLPGRGGGNAGQSYVVFGKAEGFSASLDLTALDGTNGFRLSGISRNDWSGESVSYAGDVNGDGLDDIIIGARQGDPPGTSNAGESYVVFGSGEPFSANFNLSMLDGANGFQINGIETTDFSGEVSFAGDVNGDGLDDVIIGAVSGGSNPQAQLAGECYVVFGAASEFAPVIDLETLDGKNGFTLYGSNFRGSVGGSVSAGDINGDGLDDVIISAYRGAYGYSDGGESYVVFGRGDGFSPRVDLSALNGIDGFRLIGIDRGDSGNEISTAGDVNGDGFDDLIIGAPGGDPHGSNSGESYVVFGKAEGFAPAFDLATLDGSNGFQINGIDLNDGSGNRVSAAGDVNADGFDDVIIGARQADPHGNRQAGESYVVFGKADGYSASVDLATLDGTNGFRISGVDAGDESGSSVSTAGDVNGDGFDDLIVGAWYADPDGVFNAGESYVIFGVAPTEAVARTGSSGDQTIRGGEFDDTLYGKGGNDRLAGGGGADTLNGGTGKDWAYYDVAKAGVRASLASPDTNTGEAAGDRYRSIENLRGSAFDDTLVGNRFDNRLRGDGGADRLSGFGGNDALIGNAGHDRLTGGKGADGFFFDSLSSADSDTITDFTSGVDRIVLDDVFGLPGGALAPGSFVLGGTAQDADDRLIYNTANGNLFFDADGTGASAQVLIGKLKGAPTLTAADFQVDGAPGASPISGGFAPPSDAPTGEGARGVAAQMGMVGVGYGHGASLLPDCHAMLV